MTRGPLLVALLVLLTLPAGGGCVRRRITVRSNPPGALVFIDDQKIGVTPTSTSFVYYGTRKIQLIRDGYETVTEKHTFNPPWYQVPPLDFISENLWPTELRDERELEFSLQPQAIVSREELVERAQQLRGGALQGVATPLGPPAAPVPAAPGAVPPEYSAPAGPVDPGPLRALSPDPSPSPQPPTQGPALFAPPPAR